MIKIGSNINKCLGAILLISLVLTGCGSLDFDITPPAAENETGQIPETPQPTPVLSQEFDQPSPTLSEEEKEDELIAVNIIDHTGGRLVEQGLEVELAGYENFELVYEDAQTLTSGNRVLFSEAPFVEGRVYFASISKGGAIYRSEIVELGAETTWLNLNIQIFDTTTNDENLVIDRVHLLVDFPSPDYVQIVEIYILSNLGDATVVPADPGGATISFPLPSDAESIEFENGELGQRYLQTQDGFADTVSVPPGSGVYQVLVYYKLPVQRNRIRFTQEMPYPVQAVILMYPEGEAVLKGSSLEDQGVQAIPDGSVQLYSGAGLARGESLDFRLTIESETGALRTGDADFLSQGVIIGAGVLGGLIFLIGLWLLISRNRQDVESGPELDAAESAEQILDSIIALEDLYNEGEIDEKDFLKKRQELKDKLTTLEGD